MEKIYNNLTIKNLIKTDWFKQFNEEQKNEIRLGKQRKINLSYFVNPKFSAEQMKQIRFGLNRGLDVSIYAKKELNWKKMREIREELLKESTL